MTSVARKISIANNTLGKGEILDIMPDYNNLLSLIIAASKAVSRTM